MAAVSSSEADTSELAEGDGDELIGAVLQASRVLAAVATRSLAAVDDSVTLPQFRTLVVLVAQGPRRLADLADALGVSPSTATRMCDRLARKGLIDRARDEFDRREINLVVTASGRELVAEVATRRRREGAVLAGCLSGGDRRTVAAALGKVAAQAGVSPEPPCLSGWLA